MPITIYTLIEARKRLAELRGRVKGYTRQGFIDALERFQRETGRRPQGSLLFTDDELREIADTLRGPGRPGPQ
jgi:hypothetical protein